LRETLGSEVLVHFQVSPSGPTWVARVHAQTAAKEGERIVLAVDPRNLHFFDPATGKAL
jgi:sn-glycerol 3-phosphate transport system ATP-binding protein